MIKTLTDKEFSSFAKKEELFNFIRSEYKDLNKTQVLELAKAVAHLQKAEDDMHPVDHLKAAHQHMGDGNHFKAQQHIKAATEKTRQDPIKWFGRTQKAKAHLHLADYAGKMNKQQHEFKAQSKTADTGEKASQFRQQAQQSPRITYKDPSMKDKEGAKISQIHWPKETSQFPEERSKPHAEARAMQAKKQSPKFVSPYKYHISPDLASLYGVTHGE